MKKIPFILLLSLCFCINLHAQSTSPAETELTKMLNDFLAGASSNDLATHEKFWADDLIYTGSSGRRIGKKDIIDGIKSAPKNESNDTVYSSEDVRIQQYGAVAIVAFRLVGTTTKDGNTIVAKFLNSGTFIKRNNRWVVVNWQATKLPRSKEDAEKAALAVEDAFHKAQAAGDIKTIEALGDDSFIWTHSNGKQVTRSQMIEEIKSGEIKYTKLDRSKITVTLGGDGGGTAIVRGFSYRRRPTDPAEMPDLNVYYTMTLVDRGGTWKVAAVHTSLPVPGAAHK